MKTPLLAVIAPAKLLDDQTHYPQYKCSQPDFTAEAEYLVSLLRKKNTPEFIKMMSVSESIASQTRIQFQNWKLPFSHKNAHPALLMFKGEVYRGLDAKSLNPGDLSFANTHLRILSGLYGVLKPMDFVMPYRLMMRSKLQLPDHKNLYNYWKEKITENLRNSIQKAGVLINLSSSEYFKAIDTGKLGRSIISVEFLEKKGNGYVNIATYSKLARGKMARFLIEEKIEKSDHLKAFDIDQYRFNPNHSDEKQFTFTR